MQKVIIDTNVIVSAFIQSSYPFLIIELFFENKIQLCMSGELKQEYVEVLIRPKFRKYLDFEAKAAYFLQRIDQDSVMYSPQTKLNIISDDADNRILELAEECDADFIITGNTTDFIMSEHKYTKIVTPKEYWENYKPE